MGTNKKRGISLIVLVITIIVMIILATAIILSLSNSGIIGKTNKAKTDSDTANLKEYVNTLKAEWELMTPDERTNAGSSTFEDYANKKLEEKGYNKAAVGADGEVYSNLNESAKTAVKAGIKVGDTVTGYTITEKTYETSGNENNNVKQTLKPDIVATWKYIGIGEDGSLEISTDVSSHEISKSVSKYKISLLATDGPTGSASDPKKTLTLSGKGGYLNGPAELDKACAALYSTDKGTAKSINIDHVIRILGYAGEKGEYIDTNGRTIAIETPLTIGEIETKLKATLKYRETPDGKDLKTYKVDFYSINKTASVSKMYNAQNVELIYPIAEDMEYWLASSCVHADFENYYDDADFRVWYVNSYVVFSYFLFDSKGKNSDATYTLRPVVSLNSNVTITKDGDGVWKIS